MKTVLYVLGAGELAGAERVLITLISELDRSKIRPVVAVAEEGPVVPLLREAGADVVMLPSLGRVRALHRLPGAVRRLARVIAAHEIDIVQANGEKVSIYAGLAARVAGRPCVFWLHDAPGAGSARAVQGLMARVPHAAAVTCARWLADAFAARYRMTPEPILNGVTEPSVARVDLGWPDDAIVVTFAGRLQRWKGPHVFVRAAAGAAKRDPRLRFLVVGGALFGREVDFAESLPALAEELGLGDTMRFMGYRSDVLDIVAASDIAVHASIEMEPFPMAIIEAMTLGTPIIATAVGGPEEMITHGETGLLLPPGDVDALAEAMCSLASDPDARARLGRAARTYARAHLTADRMAREFEALYDRIGA